MTPITEALLSAIAAQVGSRMEDQEMKQYVVAQEAHISENTIRNIRMARDHRISTLSELAESMGCDLLIELRPKS